MSTKLKTIAISWSIEFGPISVFFISLSFLGDTDQGFIFATGIFTLLTVVALLASYLIEKRIAWFPIIAGLSVVLFGILTLISKDPIFFMVKDTFYNGFFAAFLLIGALYKKALLKPLFESLFDMKEKGWLILSVRWGVFFLLLTVTNEIVWRGYGRELWVTFKFWSTLLTIVFGFYQLTLSKKYRNDSASPYGVRTTLLKKGV